MALTTDIQQQVFDLLTRASNVSFVTADIESGSISKLTPGQKVNAEVLSLFPNNRVQVRVGSERFNLDLPMAARIGQTLEMTFVSGDPRSTFAIARQSAVSPPVTLSDASRLLSLLISTEKMVNPELRSALQSISSMMRSSLGESVVLANILDEALIYSSGGDATVFSPESGGDALAGRINPDQARLATFETNASQLLKNIAQNSRFTLIESANHPATPLPLLPGEEINATVAGTLSGGRSLVQVAGTNLELILPQKVMPGEILRLTYLSAEPKPTFALLRAVPDNTLPPLLSEAGRWLSVLEHSEGGVSKQQSLVFDRLSTVLKSLPPGSPVFSAISDDAITYQRSQRPQSAEISASLILSERGEGNSLSGNGILLSDDMAKLLQAVIKGNRIALLESLNKQSGARSFAPGEQLKGEVLATVGGGRFTVQVAGEMLEFLMPKGIRRGDLINLFFISEEPRQTFLMVRFGRTGESKVSETGRWLSSFLGEASAQMPAQATLSILKTLLAEPTSDARLLGQMLQQGLRESGLFYESHLARWFGGDYQLKDILREPQGRLSSRIIQSAGQDIISSDELALAGVRSKSAEVMEALFKQVGVSMAHEGIADQRSLPIVSEQLLALQNNGQLLFRGEIFPGQHMEWSVAEREAGRNNSGERERNWESGITVNLPNLGEVTAKLILDGTRIAVKIIAKRDESVPVLEAGTARLAEQLEGAGLTPAEMNIQHAAA